MKLVSTKFGMTRDLARVSSRQLGCDVLAQIVREHRDGVGPLIADALEPTGRRDHARPVEHAELDRHVGEDILDVEHERRPTSDRDGEPGQAERERRRHGEHPVNTTAHGPDSADKGTEPAERKRSTRDVALVGRERMDPRDLSPRHRLGADGLAAELGVDAVVLIPGQGRDHIDAVAARCELVDDLRDDLARRCDVGGEMRAEHQQLHVLLTSAARR